MSKKSRSPPKPLQGPVFLTRIPKKQSVELFQCSEAPACLSRTIEGIKALEIHAKDHPYLISANGTVSTEYIERCRLRFHNKSSQTVPRTVARLVPPGPASDFHSVVPNPSDVSQSGQRAQAPGPTAQTQSQGITSERSTATALSNLQINKPSGKPDESSGGDPPSPSAGRKRRAGDVSRERRQRARSSGKVPQSSSHLASHVDVPSPPKQPALQEESDGSAGSATKVTGASPTRENEAKLADEMLSGLAEATRNPANEQRNTMEKPSLAALDVHHEKHPPPPPVDIKEATPVEEDYESLEEPELLLQPETKPISQAQLIVEVRGIYAGLVLVEAKCIDVDARQIALAQEPDSAKLSAEQWRALIALHKTLLHEHHDFFLASQHPAATFQLSKLAEKYAMPSRMWRHAIHGFLEVLRHRLPDSLEYMLAFVYIAYSMIALLYETVPSFENTWIECLGDLARYRMSIDEDVQDREAWGGVARFWYAKALERIPQTGRLYHHQAILARPFSVQQLSLYARSLTCQVPFPSARISIRTLFNPVLERQKAVMSRANPIELLIIRAHSIIFTGQAGQEFLPSVADLVHGLLDKFLGKAGSKAKEMGLAIAQANIGALLGYGLTTPTGVPLGLLDLTIKASLESQNLASKAHPKEGDDSNAEEKVYTREDLSSEELAVSENLLVHASVLCFGILTVMLKRYGDRNVLPGIHVHVLFIWFLTRHPAAMELLQSDIPWMALTNYLNTLLKMSSNKVEVKLTDSFPIPEGNRRPLSEDFRLRGQCYAQGYLPEGWCEDAGLDDEERSLELPSMHLPRTERILWLAQKIAAKGIWITYDPEKNRFAATDLAKSFQARQIVTILSPHPLPPEQGLPDGSKPPVTSSPQQGAATSSAIPSNPASSEQDPSLPAKEALGSSTKLKQEDVEMPDVPNPLNAPIKMQEEDQ